MTTVVQEERPVNHLMVVKKSYLTGFFGSLGVVLLGLLASSLLNEFYPLEEGAIRLLQAFSVVPGSATLFAVQGWDIQTWGGHSPAEHLNHKLFTRFSLAGLFLPVVAFSLNSAPLIEPSQMEEAIFQKLKSDILNELVIKKAIPDTIQIR